MMTWIKRMLKHFVLIMISLTMVFPFLWMLISALKTNEEIFRFPPSFIPDHPHWNIFNEAWQSAPFWLYMFNSSFTAGAIVAIQILNSAMIGYALTHMRFSYKKPLLAFILISYMLPAAATYLPSYIILAKLGLMDSYSGLIISNAVSVFSIFLIRQAFMQLPYDVVEAAKIDGAGHWRILWTILVPLAKPTFVVMGLLTFISNYNNYLWPSLITRNPNLELVSQGLQSFFIQGGGYGMQWPLIMAASSFTIAPLLLLFVIGQKWILRGVTAFDVNK